MQSAVIPDQLRVRLKVANPRAIGGKAPIAIMANQLKLLPLELSHHGAIPMRIMSPRSVSFLLNVIAFADVEIVKRAC